MEKILIQGVFTQILSFNERVDGVALVVLFSCLINLFDFCQYMILAKERVTFSITRVSPRTNRPLVGVRVKRGLYCMDWPMRVDSTRLRTLDLRREQNLTLTTSQPIRKSDD